jgi:hypothetical protein
VAAIKYQNVPFKMPRTDVGGDKFYYMPANSVSISHAAKLQPQAVLIQNQPPEMRLAGAFETKIQATFPICNKFANDDPSEDSFNFASGVIANLTGDSPTDLYIGDSSQVFGDCYVDNYSIQIAPFQSAVMSVNFTCTDPITGLPFVGSSTFATPSGLTNKFAYGHLSEIVGGSEFSDSNQSSISYSVDCKRTYSFALSPAQRTVENVFLDEINKKISIKATNINNFITESGSSSTIRVDLKNESNELVLPTGAIFISSRGRLNTQNLTMQAGGFLEADVTIDEAVL